jgi:hypothetical protein
LIIEPADTEKVQNFATAALCKTFLALNIFKNRFDYGKSKFFLKT